MNTGRITTNERERRIKLLLQFVFLFRYATKQQLFMFACLIIDISDPRRLIDYSIKNGFLSIYREPGLKVGIYHLAVNGKNLIYEQEVNIEYYHFDKRAAGINTFLHHNAVVDTYFLLNKHIAVKEWISEFTLRIDKHRREKIPDALILLEGGTKIALEVETSYKSYPVLKHLVDIYRYDITKISRYDAVLLITPAKDRLASIMHRLSNYAPDFCAGFFIFADLEMLKQGLCIYKNRQGGISEALKLLNESFKGMKRGQADDMDD